jgi:D-serine deaminase-like pyridoxal phosphate-dependent protein
VAGRYPTVDRILIHGGAIHFSKERILQKGYSVYGRRVKRTELGWTSPDEERFLTGLSQEHGIIEPSGALINEVNIGDLLLFQPVHSCLTANLMKEYRTLEGKRITTMNSGSE